MTICPVGALNHIELNSRLHDHA